MLNESKSNRNQGSRLLYRILPGVVVVVLISVIAVLAAQISREGEDLKARREAGLRNERPAPNIVALEVVPGTITDRINLPGVVEPWVKLNIVAEVKGKIVAKRVDDGVQVKKGAVLALIDDRDYRNTVTSAQANVDAAVAAYNRLKALFDDQLATQSQLDDALARQKTTRAALDMAQLDLERCVIRAPMDGVVNQVLIENGQFLNAADPVAEMLQIDRVKVTVGIPESDVAAVRKVRHCRITIEALGSRAFEGACRYLAKTTGNLARLYNLEIELQNSDGVILPDMFARVSIVKDRVSDGLSVPLYALVKSKTQSAVYVVEDDVARLKPVTIGIQEGWQVQVKNGLRPGDRVVVVGQHSVNDGQAVNVTRTVQDPGELTL